MKVLIIGGGKVGTYLASHLLAGNHEIVVVEQRREELERLQRELGADHVILGNGTDPVVLESAGIRTMQVIAAVTGSDETNLVVTNLSRFEFNVPRTIARVNNPKNDWMFTEDMGVDVALNQADLMVHLILEEMSMGDMMTLLKLRRGKFSIVEEKLAPQSSLVGLRLDQAKLPRDSVILAVMRKDDILVPHGSLILQASDEIIALVHGAQLDQLEKLLNS
ncbi:MAG: TrkA family potassium uptake protein [Anaerolineaceae bacterium]|jgi:trk system potassium uptake protein TrkA|nr:MAG: TrkA family potassium uptake protein [Anaerolineaceae bacterium]